MISQAYSSEWARVGLTASLLGVSLILREEGEKEIARNSVLARIPSSGVAGCVYEPNLQKMVKLRWWGSIHSRAW